MTLKLDGRAALNGLIAVLLLVAAIYLGSGRMRHFDPALIAYTCASVLALFGIVYRYSVWLQRPPTRLYWERGIRLILGPRELPTNIAHLAVLFVRIFVLQTFIERRSHI